MKLVDKFGNPISILIIGSHVRLENLDYDFVVRDGYTIENSARQVGKIEYNGKLKVWVCMEIKQKENSHV
jgi:hypothetical protein